MESVTRIVIFFLKTEHIFLFFIVGTKIMNDQDVTAYLSSILNLFILIIYKG